MVFCGVVKEMVTMPSTRSRKFHAIKLVTQSLCFSFFCFFKKGLAEHHFLFTGVMGLWLWCTRESQEKVSSSAVKSKMATNHAFNFMFCEIIFSLILIDKRGITDVCRKCV